MKVFWAWQSDIDPKVGRYFVRDALEAAISKIKESEEILEPPEESRLRELHLDFDTNGHRTHSLTTLRQIVSNGEWLKPPQ